MQTQKLFSRQPWVVWVREINAFVDTRRQLAVDGDIVAEDVADAIQRGDLADTADAVTEFCGSYFEVSADVCFSVQCDERGRWQRTD